MWRSLHGLAGSPTPASQDQEGRQQQPGRQGLPPQGLASQAQQTRDASTLESLGKVSAEACDQMIGNLKQAKNKVRFSKPAAPSTFLLAYDSGGGALIVDVGKTLTFFHHHEAVHLSRVSFGLKGCKELSLLC